jgi:hypothetical protein
MMMRAKMKVSNIEANPDYGTETLSFSAVAKNGAYPEDGSDENNTYAKYTPMAEMRMTIQNPALIGKFAIDQMFYVDFTEAAK